MLLSLKDFGEDISVNPKYVTSILKSGSVVMLWVVGHAGYGTFSVALKNTTVDEVTEYLNNRKHT